MSDAVEVELMLLASVKEKVALVEEGYGQVSQFVN